MPFIATKPEGRAAPRQTMTRAELELLTSDHRAKPSSRAAKALADAKVTAADIESVVLVGGMTRMPAVQKR